MRMVYLSPVPWASFSQRPHKFVEWFHLRYGGEVLWVDPYPTRFPAWRDLRRLRSDSIAGTGHEPERSLDWLTVVKPHAFPAEPMYPIAELNTMLWQRTHTVIGRFLSGGGRRLIGVGKPSGLALGVLQRYPRTLSLFDAMDDYPAFYKGLAKRLMETRVRSIAAHVSRILVSSEALKRRFRDQKAKVQLVRNACDADALPPASPVRPDGGAPVLGYVGTIGDWFDWPLIAALAKAAPAARIRLVGPRYSVPRKPLPDNVELRPSLDHGAAIGAMREFSAGLIPFRYTELTYAVDPIKYYEYHALGLPIISSRFGRMAFRDSDPGVFLVDEHADLALQTRAALGYRYDEDEIRTFREENSWTARFDASRLLED